MISAHRYGIDAMGAMAQGTVRQPADRHDHQTRGQQLGLAFLVTAGGYAAAVAGPAMAASIGYAARAAAGAVQPDRRGRRSNELGGAGNLAVYLIAIIAAEVGKLVSKGRRIDILVTPAVHNSGGASAWALFAPSIGAVASAVGNLIMWATELQPSDGHCGFCAGRHGANASHLSAAICAALGLTVWPAVPPWQAAARWWALRS